MKYIDAEKLRKEIEFAKSVYGNPQRVVHGIADAFRQDGRVAMCDDILKKLDSLQQEQPKFNVGDLIVSKKNPHLTYKILATNLPNELGKTDYKVEIFTDGKPGILDEPHNIHLISSDKIEDWGELVRQEQPKVDLEKEYKTWWDSIAYKINVEHVMEWYMHETARHFYKLGLNARKEE